jgi:hypothetical protein
MFINFGDNANLDGMRDSVLFRPIYGSIWVSMSLYMGLLYDI